MRKALVVAMVLLVGYGFVHFWPEQAPPSFKGTSYTIDPKLNYSPKEDIPPFNDKPLTLTVIEDANAETKHLQARFGDPQHPELITGVEDLDVRIINKYQDLDRIRVDIARYEAYNLELKQYILNHGLKDPPAKAATST